MNRETLHIAIVGAARRRQGTGPFIASMLHRLGHSVCGFVGTSPHSIHTTQAELNTRFGIDCRGYLSLHELLSEHTIDVVVVCSPAYAHHSYVEEALQNNCDVLVEKPMLWVDDSKQYDAILQQLLNLAVNKDRLLYLISQWPFTLPYFRQLYPDASFDPANIYSFSMQLSPISHGKDMIIDSGSHLLSMLYSLLGIGSIHNLRLSNSPDTKPGATTLEFEYQHTKGQTEVCFRLHSSNATVKPASYAINERSVIREVILPEYTIRLRSSQQQCVINDPMLLCIKDFLAALYARIDTDTELLLNHGRHLRLLAEQLNIPS